MKYYACVYEQFPSFEKLTRPPFRVVERATGFYAFVEFEDDGLAMMQAFYAENDSTGYAYDEKRRRYRISGAGIELRKSRAMRGFYARVLRRMRRIERWNEQDQALCEGVTEPVIIPNSRTPWFFRHKRYIYIRPGREHPFRYTLRSPKDRARSGELGVCRHDRREPRGWPLVIYLHGAGAGGTKGLMPLLHFMLTIPRVRQKYHLLVPQEGLLDIYGDEFSEALSETIAGIPNVDRSRIYITGMSMGGCGAIIECSRHPERYAAAVPTVAWLYNLKAGKKTRSAMAAPLDAAAYDALAKTPIWLTYSRLEQRLNEQLCEALRARDADLRHTHIRLRGMCGHVIAPMVFSLTKPWAKWMFSKRKV